MSIFTHINERADTQEERQKIEAINSFKITLEMFIKNIKQKLGKCYKIKLIILLLIISGLISSYLKMNHYNLFNKKLLD